MSGFFARYSGGGGGGGGGVQSLNTLTGALTLAAGSGITITDNGTNTITVSSNITGGNLTDVGTDGIVITNGTGAVIGAGTQIAQHVADSTHNGYLSAVDWNVFNGKQPSGNYITDLTGDGTATGPGSVGFTLAIVNSDTGIWGDQASVSSFTVNDKGLILAASQIPILIAESQVTNLVSDLAAKQSKTLTNTHILVGNVSNIATDVALSGDATLANTGALTLATVNSNVGNFGLAASVSTFTVNAKGLITAASNTSIQIAESQVTNLVSDLAAKQSTTLTTNHILVGAAGVAADVAMSGDATIIASGALTLATVNSNVGSFTNASITVNAKGLITAASSAATTGSGSTVLATAPTLSSPIVGTQSQGDTSTKAASTAYVDTAVTNALAGVNPAEAVQAATTSASDTSSLTYNNGASGVGATFTGTVNTALTVDGVTFTTLGQRLLVKNDTQSPSGAFNGVYYVTQVQTIALAPILTRALDYNTPSNINNAGAIPVISGTVNGTTSWLQTSVIAAVGTTPLTFVQFTKNPASYLLAANNLSDVASQQTSLNNLAGSVTSASYLRGNGSNITMSAIQAADVPTLNQNTTGTASNITGSSNSTITTLTTLTTASSLASIGTITTGTWSATTIAVNKGGTGQTSYTDGQLLIGNTSGNTLTKATITAGTNITVTNGNGTITIGATATGFAYVSQATTLNPAVVGSYYLLSGASFTVTLPTAVGIAGQLIEFQHNGTSLSQVYTFNTKSSQTIGGVASGAGALYFNGETIQVVSDGANWQIANRYIPSIWTAFTPASGTNQGIGTLASVNMYRRRVGDSWEIRGSFITGTSAGTEARLAFIQTGETQTSTANIGAIDLAGPVAFNLNSASSVYALIEPSVAYLTFSLQNSTNAGLTKQTGSSGLGSTRTVSVKAMIPIAGWTL